MKYVLTHFQGDWSWVSRETDDVLIYNRSTESIPNSISRENIGDADYDKLTYLIDFYDSLPELFLWSKSNLFKYISPSEFDEVKNNQVFTPLLTKHHKTYSDQTGLVNWYDENGIYRERNDSWYLGSVPARLFKSFDEWATYFNLPSPAYIPFAPGGSYILTRERVHRHPKDLYKRMRDFLPWSQRPGEAQLCERSYFLLWS